MVEIALRAFFPVAIFTASTAGNLASITGWGPSTNSRGDALCDLPHRFENPDHRTRVLLLGDSILDCNTGSQPFADTVPSLLAQRLGPDYEIINLSAGGWGTDQELLAYESLG